MQLNLKYDLPFVSVRLVYQRTVLDIGEVLVDTGSASTIFAADQVETLGIVPLPGDRLSTIRGVGGREVVFSRRVDCLQVGSKKLTDFEIEIGGMDYGFEINGILGMDFLIEAGAVLDLKTLRLEFGK